MIVALFVIASVVFSGALLTSALQQVKDKVDVRAYFLTTAQESDILSLKKKLEALPEVDHVDYVSSADNLAAFQAKHSNDQLVLQALSELDNNPLGATLNIRTKELSQYQGIADFLQHKNILGSDGGQMIDKVDYDQNNAKKLAIDRLTAIIAIARKLGLIITLVLVGVALMIIFNTIRLVIYMSREEISIMKLVGASNMYIRGPFFITGVMYGVLAGIIVLAILYPVTYYATPFTDALSLTNLFRYYMLNFGQIFALIVGSGALIGGISSYLAVRKYLQV